MDWSSSLLNPDPPCGPHPSRALQGRPRSLELDLCATLQTGDKVHAAVRLLIYSLLVAVFVRGSVKLTFVSSKPAPSMMNILLGNLVA